MSNIILTTERLLLRPYSPTDFATCHAYASSLENTWYVPFGPNSEMETWDFLNRKFKSQSEEVRMDYDFAICLRETGEHIGGGGFHIRNDERTVGEVGWLINMRHWKQGYGTEFCAEMLRFGFEDLKLHRVYARCNADNYGSYRVMERNRMRREAHFVKATFGKVGDHKEWCDELVYAMLRDDWETSLDIDRVNALPVHFDGFIDLPPLTDGVIELKCSGTDPANPQENLVPQYRFDITKDGRTIGGINLRIGYSERLYYGGQIGYGIDEEHRGNGYAAAACRLLFPVAKAHGMTKLFITNNVDNDASRRVCEKLSAKFVRVARLPYWLDLYRDGQRLSNIFELDI